VSSPHVSYSPRADATAEARISVLANVYRFVLDCRANKEATRPGSPDDAERDLSDSAKNHSTA
jgi:hypothetical protein